MDDKVRELMIKSLVDESISKINGSTSLENPKVTLLSAALIVALGNLLNSAPEGMEEDEMMLIFGQMTMDLLLEVTQRMGEVLNA